jgi:hypothetical protein
VNEIIRKRLVDGSEWIISRQMWRGLDQLGNAIDISMNDKETYDDVLPIYTQSQRTLKTIHDSKTQKWFVLSIDSSRE